MDFMRALKSPLNDSGWLGKMMSLFFSCFTMFASSGYSIAVARQVAYGNERELPDWTWTSFWAYWSEGFKYCLVIFLYNLPFSIISLVFRLGGAYYAVSSDAGDSSLLIVKTSVAVISFLCSCAQWAVLALTPAITVAFVFGGGTFKSGFNFSKIYSVVTNNFGKYFLTLLFASLFTILGDLGLFVLVIGCVITVPWALISTANLYGQLAQANGDFVQGEGDFTQGNSSIYGDSEFDEGQGLSLG